MVNLIPQVYRIQGNQPLLLNEPQTIWIVNSGSLAVFTTVFEGKEPKGNRRYLFTVNAGEALLGATPKDGRGILAIALEETELSALNIEDFITQIQTANPSSIALLSGWVNHWEKLAIPDLPLDSKIQKKP
jgi:hypothetical protein